MPMAAKSSLIILMKSCGANYGFESQLDPYYNKRWPDCYAYVNHIEGLSMVPLQLSKTPWNFVKKREFPPECGFIPRWDMTKP